jgi:hypothetical protein
MEQTKEKFFIEHILPISLPCFWLPQNLLEDTLIKVKKLQFKTNQTNQVSVKSLNCDLDFEKLHFFLNKCLVDVIDFFDFPFERLVITESWANKAIKGESHHYHKHPNSLISGIVYLTSHKSAGTYFADRDIWKDNLFYYGFDGDRTQDIKARAGKIIIFPSRLAHGAFSLEEDNEERYTISFNVFPTGKIGIFTSGLLLDTKPFISL